MNRTQETQAQYEAFQRMALVASETTKCGDAYVSLTVAYNPDGSQFVMTRAGRAGGLQFVKLDCANTSQERLNAHVAGVVETHRAEWATSAHDQTTPASRSAAAVLVGMPSGDDAPAGFKNALRDMPMLPEGFTVGDLAIAFLRHQLATLD